MTELLKAVLSDPLVRDQQALLDHAVSTTDAGEGWS